MSVEDSTLMKVPEQARRPRRRRQPLSGTDAGMPPSTWSVIIENRLADEEKDEPLSWRNLGPRFLLWLRSAYAAGYGISLLFHLLALFVMSLVIYTELTNEEALQTSITESEDIEMLQDVMDVRIDMPAGDVSATDALQTALDLETTDWADNPVVTGVETSLESLFEKEGSGGAGGAGFLVPKNTRVFRKGSFSAWTVPNDPKPGEDYQIVIVVKLPERVKRYQASDLKGMVIGTDGYKQEIPGREYTRGRVYLPMQDNTAQLIISVPGAVAKVKDKIEIRSTTLNEKQILEITF